MSGIRNIRFDEIWERLQQITEQHNRRHQSEPMVVKYRRADMAGESRSSRRRES